MMKTTLDVDDDLVADARALAEREGTTLDALIERGLRKLLEGADSSRPFRMRDASVGGCGLHGAMSGLTWARLREHAYEDREN